MKGLLRRNRKSRNNVTPERSRGGDDESRTGMSVIVKDEEFSTMVSKVDELQMAIDQLAERETTKHAYPITRSSTKEDLKKHIALLEQRLAQQQSHMKTVEDQMMTQNSHMVDIAQNISTQNKEMQKRLQGMAPSDDDEESDDGEIQLDKIPQGHYDVKQGPTLWRVNGYSSIEPHPDFEYYPGLQASEDLRVQFIRTKKVISAIVPCYTEGAVELDRTIRSLFRQRHMKGWRVEVVVVMDGSDRIDESMGERLHDIFGVTFNTGNEDDPFVKLPGAETIIVEPANWEAAMTRTPAMENTIGGYTLVVKRSNHRKANSQMWWLGPHGSTLGCRYSLATDCGTVFGRTATIHLIRRLDAEPDLHAVTGFQRIMTSDMQGDGAFEWLNNPAAHILRMCQRFEFEVDHVSFKAVYDTFGCMHVIPGPCGLFRYRAMGSMREGLMKQYFSLFQNSNQGLIVGNVELVEDRIPGTLLSFPQKENVKDLNIRPEEGWPRTGFVHDAIFYIEAEKPLSQLVKQRRRWTNGTFATYLWMVMEGIITRSNQDPTNKVVSWLLIMISIVQGMTVRLFGPALLIVWMFRFGLFLPDLVIDPRVMFDPDLSLVELEIEEERLPYGLLLSGLYTLLHVAFIIGHVPRAKPGKGRTEITRHTDPLWYQNDKNSAYRGWLFIPVVVVNAFVILLYILNAVGIVVTLGWKETPFIVRMLMVICFSPFILGFLDGLVRRDLRCMWGMMISIPGALPLMIFFTVWLPAYSTTRLSDLTWGNRVGAGLDESSQALKRANDGMRVAIFLIAFNLLVSLVVIFFMQFYSETFPIFVVSYTAILSVTLVISFQDLVVRFLTCHYCYNSVSDDELIEEEDEVHEPEPEEESEADGYTELESESAAPNDDHKTTTTNNKAIEDHSLVGASINGGPGDYQKMDESTGDYQKMEDTPPGYMQDTPPGYMQDKPPGYIHT